MSELSTIYDYMRANAALLGARILEEYSALHQFDEAVSPRVDGLLRRPFPAQAIAIMGLAKRWREARTAMVVAECGTGKTLISLGSVHVHSAGRPYTALAMVPPHLVDKWAREAFLTLPGVPTLVLTMPIEIYPLGWREAAAVVPLVTAILLLLIEVKLADWNKIPFTCSYVPGRQSVWFLAAKGLAFFGVGIPLVSLLEVYLLQSVALSVSTIMIWAAYLHIRTERQERWGAQPLLFDEREDAAISPLNFEI